MEIHSQLSIQNEYDTDSSNFQDIKKSFPFIFFSKELHKIANKGKTRNSLPEQLPYIKLFSASAKLIVRSQRAVNLKLEKIIS